MSTVNEKKFTKDHLIALIVFIWPFLYLFRYIIADQPFSLKLKMDVIYHYYPMVYLLDALSHLKFPLWSPAEAGGFPFFSSPFNQAFYPLNLLFALYYKVIGGFSWVDYQRFSVLGISIFAVNLYYWLRSLKINWRAALLAVLIMSVSFKVAGSLNRIQATHSAAWMVMILWGLTVAIYNGQGRKGGLLIGIGTLLLITCSYPYYIYYSIFLFPPYILALLFSKTRTTLVGENIALNVKKYLSTIITAFAIPAAICLPYLYKIAQLSNEISDRDKGDFSYAVKGDFSLLDTLGALILPPYSDMRGWYYFGFIALLLIIIYIISHFYSITRHKKYHNKLLLGLLGGYFVFVSLVTYGDWPLFKLFWTALPGFSGFRVWARLNIILIPVFALLLAKAYYFIEQLLTDPDYKVVNSEKPLNTFITWFGLVYGGILAIQLYFYFFEKTHIVWRRNILSHFPETDTYFYLKIGFIYFMGWVFVLFYSNAISKKTKEIFNLGTTSLQIGLITLLVLLSSFDMGIAHVKLRSQNKTASSHRKVIDVPKMNDNAFNTKRSYNIRLTNIKTETPFSVLHGKMWFFKRYNQFFKREGGVDPKEKKRNGLRPKERRSKDLDQFLGVVDGQRLYFTSTIKHKNIKAFLGDSEKYKHNLDGIEVVNYTGDYLELEVDNNKGGYLSFIDNWDADWYVQVNGELGEIELLFDTFKSVSLRKGKNQVQFFYNPFPFSLIRGFPDLYQKTEAGTAEQEELFAINNLSSSLAVDKVVIWTDTVGVEIVTDSIKHSQILRQHIKGGKWGRAGAASSSILPAREDGCVEFPISQTGKNMAIGLSSENKNAHLQSMEYAFFLTNANAITVQEKGKYKGNFGTYKFGDKLRVERIEDKVYYRKNGKVLYISEIPSTSSLVVDVGFLNKGARFKNVRTSF